MKKWFVLSFALVIAAVSQAVTVAWTVPNSEYDWAYKNNGSELSFNVYFVYSANTFNDSGELVASGALDAAGAYEKVAAGIDSNGLINGGKNSNLTYGYDDYYEGETKVHVYGDSLGPAPNSTTNKVNGSGFYYMVVINKEEPTKYAVAGTTSAVNFANGEDADKENGIYASNVGRVPDIEDYLDMKYWLGGTWEAALVPEPTILALLAMGVAGVALRRKQNFLK